MIRVSFPQGHGGQGKSHLSVSIVPGEGPYRGAVVVFIFDIPPEYPYNPPRVRCVTSIFHPNIQPDTGFVGLPLLGIDWRAVLSVNTVVFGLQLLLISPDPGLPGNPDCSALFREQGAVGFETSMQRLIHGNGAVVNGKFWPPISSSRPYQQQEPGRRSLLGTMKRRLEITTEGLTPIDPCAMMSDDNCRMEEENIKRVHQQTPVSLGCKWTDSEQKEEKGAETSRWGMENPPSGDPVLHRVSQFNHFSRCSPLLNSNPRAHLYLCQ